MNNSELFALEARLRVAKQHLRSESTSDKGRDFWSKQCKWIERQIETLKARQREVKE